MANDAKPTGLTKDAGWQIGVRRTLPVPVDAVWEFLTNPAGARIWLGDGAVIPTERGERVVTADGGQGELRSLRHKDRVRLRWRATGWTHDTTVQIAVRGDERKTSITFHEEWLADENERAQQREHWRSVADAIERELLPGA